ncbi:MAG TPA: asparaginase [Firmicutes bacterium]|jgi:L-asparaginase II|nr:asparaginase [Bacillota bacterium]
MSDLWLHATRGTVVESRHMAHLVITNPAGDILVAAGAPDRLTYWRSAAKPIQAIPLVASGGTERFGLTDEEIAVITASHAGEPAHIAAVESVLAKCGIGEEWLRCGAHLPFSTSDAEALIRRGELPRAIHSNCSGKHAGMLALALLRGWPLHGYMELEHPVQQEALAMVALFTGVPQAVIPTAVDGCGVPTYALPLHALATAYARLAVPEVLPESVSMAVRRITTAMRRHPYMTAGSGRFCTALMAATGERIIAKSGAEGFVSMGLPELGLGMALKVEDGASRAVAPLAMEILCRLGVLDEEESVSLADLHQPVIRNLVGFPVGGLQPQVSEALAQMLHELRKERLLS